MLPKTRRIQRKDFSKVLSLGKRYNTPNLLVYVLPVSEQSGSRFAFSVSKKVCPKAVDRNRLRRRGYSVVGKYIQKVNPGFLCLFSFKKGSGSITFKTLEKEVADLLGDSRVVS